MQQTKYEFDFVHDAQGVFRAVLDALANPGRWESIACQAARTREGAYGVRLALGLALLDNGVTFFAKDPALTAEVSFLTRSRAAALAEADFVFADEGDDPSAVLSAVKRGSLQAPHLSATVLVELNADREETCALEGPGVQPGSQTKLPPAARAWLAARRALAMEYPQGVDLLLYTSGGWVLGLPRLTREVTTWPM